jgi:hypothetical protein
MISNRSAAVPAFEILLGELLSEKRKAGYWVQTQTHTTNLQEVQNKHIYN